MPAPWRLMLTGVGLTGLSVYFAKDKISSKTRATKDSNRMHLQQNVPNSIDTARQIITNLQNSTTSPGISVCVAVDGEVVWEEGFGYSDLENQVKCTANSVMKIASISKPITMAMFAKQLELKKLDLDANVSDYVDTWPQKQWDGQEVEMSARLFACHMSGVRNYKKLEGNDRVPGVAEKMQYEEYFIKKHYKDINTSLELFKNDPLVSKPGTKFLYSNHGYTVLSACIESATKESFTKHAKKFFHSLDMRNTFAEDAGPLMYGRSRQYVKISEGRLENAPYVDPSFKIAGAGLWSSASDLVKFGNAMLASYNNTNKSKTMLSSETVQLLWRPVKGIDCYWSKTGGYGLGWQTEPYHGQKRIENLDSKFFVGHTGSTVGASSVLWMLPSQESEGNKGVVVAMISNLQVDLRSTATEIAKLFEQL